MPSLSKGHQYVNVYQTFKNYDTHNILFWDTSVPSAGYIAVQNFHGAGGNCAS